MVKVSIIVPVLNGGLQTKKCIESLINQDFPKDQYEIIIVDNGSNDNTMSILSDYKEYINVLVEPEKGSYAARNKGINISKGEIIAFTDADCIANKNWLKELCIGIRDKDIGCVVGSIAAYPGKTLVEIYSKNRDVLSQKITLDSKFLPYGQTANVAFRKDVLEKIGNFDNTLYTGGDADIAWRMQLMTTYKLIYRPEANVEHHHRTSIKKLFMQYFNYGIGNVLLFKKYSKTMKYNAGGSVLDWLKLGLAEFFTSIDKLIQNPSRYSILEPFLLLTCTVALRAGRLYGSLKFKSFYI
ncbi:Glycosyltransferase AglE [uncultured archaeon]|nr:Glycosyltransferase AglE [uncultured archaeon]